MARAKARRGGLFGSFLRRNSTMTGSTDWLIDMLRSAFNTRSGKTVTIETALRNSTALACGRVIAEDTAMSRLVVKTRAPGSGNRWIVQDDHWLVRLFRAPNEWQTEFDFRVMLGLHSAFSHGGYAFINRVGGKPKELLPFPPTSVKAEQDKDWSVRYRVTYPSGVQALIPAGDMLHIRGASWDGVNGLETVRLAAEAIGISIAAEESHANLHANGVKLSGILTTGQGATLDEETAKRVAKQWREEFGPDSEHAFGVAVLEGGMKFEPMAMTGAEAQHIETRHFQIEEICRFFRVHPQMIGHSTKASTNASAEQNMIAHVAQTLAPWCLRWTQAVDRSLLAQSSEPNVWVTFDPRGLLAMGDMKSRAAFYNSGIHAGWLNRNEARELEGMQRGPDELDEFLAPLQLAPGDSADAANKKNENEDPPRDTPDA